MAWFQRCQSHVAARVDGLPDATQRLKSVRICRNFAATGTAGLRTSPWPPVADVRASYRWSVCVHSRRSRRKEPTLRWARSRSPVLEWRKMPPSWRRCAPPRNFGYCRLLWNPHSDAVLARSLRVQGSRLRRSSKKGAAPTCPCSLSPWLPGLLGLRCTQPLITMIRYDLVTLTRAWFLF
jgi:hypothetical protein